VYVSSWKYPSPFSNLLKDDAARLGNKVGVSGGAKERSTGAKLSGEQIGSKVDDAVSFTA